MSDEPDTSAIEAEVTPAGPIGKFVWETRGAGEATVVWTKLADLRKQTRLTMDLFEALDLCERALTAAQPGHPAAALAQATLLRFRESSK